jgi:hypothetical protein
MARLYRSVHKPQINPTDPAGKYSCTAYAGAMAVDFATLGGVKISGHALRGLTDEAIPDPTSPGLNLAQIIEAADDLWVPIWDQSGKGWGAVMLALQARRGVILQGDRDQFTTTPCVNAFKGSHAIFIQLRLPEAGIRVCDPLCSAAHVVTEATLRRYAEKLGVQTRLANGGCRFAITRSVPLIA